jgi:hypothetical protein
MIQPRLPNTLRRYCYDEMRKAQASGLTRLSDAWHKYEETGGDNRDELDNAVAAVVTAHIARSIEELYRRAEANRRRFERANKKSGVHRKEAEQRSKAYKPSSPKHQLREMTNSSIVVPRGARFLD